jgi:hypothetical protein
VSDKQPFTAKRGGIGLTTGSLHAVDASGLSVLPGQAGDVIREAVARVTQALATEDASCVTGSEFAVVGGLSQF